jgi:hypothetical protein
MTTEHQTTPEEEAYRRLLDEIRKMLSEPARAVIEEAQSAAYAANMVHSYCFQPEEYKEVMGKIHLAAAGLNDRECKLLAKVWRAALAAAASIDPHDERLVGHKVDGRNLHWYYSMLSDMVEKAMEEKWFADRWDEIAEREPEDL